MSQDSKPADAKGSGGLLRRVFGHSDADRSGSGTGGPAPFTRKGTLNLADIQGFIVQGYACRWSATFYFL